MLDYEKEKMAGLQVFVAENEKGFWVDLHNIVRSQRLVAQEVPIKRWTSRSFSSDLPFPHLVPGTSIACLLV